MKDSETEYQDKTVGELEASLNDQSFVGYLTTQFRGLFTTLRGLVLKFSQQERKKKEDQIRELEELSKLMQHLASIMQEKFVEKLKASGQFTDQEIEKLSIEELKKPILIKDKDAKALLALITQAKDLGLNPNDLNKLSKLKPELAQKIKVLREAIISNKELDLIKTNNIFTIAKDGLSLNLLKLKELIVGFDERNVLALRVDKDGKLILKDGLPQYDVVKVEKDANGKLVVKDILLHEPKEQSRFSSDSLEEVRREHLEYANKNIKRDREINNNPKNPEPEGTIPKGGNTKSVSNRGESISEGFSFGGGGSGANGKISNQVSNNNRQEEVGDSAKRPNAASAQQLEAGSEQFLKPGSEYIPTSSVSGNGRIEPQTIAPQESTLVASIPNVTSTQEQGKPSNENKVEQQVVQTANTTPPVEHVHNTDQGQAAAAQSGKPNGVKEVDISNAKKPDLTLIQPINDATASNQIANLRGGIENSAPAAKPSPTNDLEGVAAKIKEGLENRRQSEGSKTKLDVQEMVQSVGQVPATKKTEIQKARSNVLETNNSKLKRRVE